jgi:hypothetical protein
LTSGRHDNLAVETAWTQQRRVEHVGTVGRRNQDHALIGLEAVHLDQQLVERLFALVIAAAKACATMAADGVDFIDEDDARRVLLGLLEHVAHTDAPTPTNISTKSEPEIVKNGTLASPATARAVSVLPVPGGPTSRTPRGILPPSRWNFCGSRRNSTISSDLPWLHQRRPRRQRSPGHALGQQLRLRLAKAHRLAAHEEDPTPRMHLAHEDQIHLRPCGDRHVAFVQSVDETGITGRVGLKPGRGIGVIAR